MNPRSLGPVPYTVLTAMARLGCVATAEEIIAEAGATTEAEKGYAKMALTALINRNLAERGTFDGGKYGYRLTGEGRACAGKAALWVSVTGRGWPPSWPGSPRTTSSG